MALGTISSYSRSTDCGGHAKYRTSEESTRLAFSLYTYSPVIRHWRYTKPELGYVIAIRFKDLSTSGFAATFYFKPQTIVKTHGPGKVIPVQAT